MKLSIIIVNWNTKSLLRDMLVSLYKETSIINHEVLVVDNNSHDGSVEMIINNFPKIILIKNKENLGFSKANNQAMEIAKGDYFMLLNSDTIILDRAIDKLIKYLDNHPTISMIGPKLLNKDLTFQHACRRNLPNPLNSFLYLSGLNKIFKNKNYSISYKIQEADKDKTGPTEAISGAAMMFKKEVYKKIGGLDEDFFMYGEDLDFCKRVSDNFGKIIYVSEAKIIHLHGSSSKKRQFKSLLNFYDAMWIYYKKHFYNNTNYIINIIIWIGIKIGFIMALIANYFK